MTKGRAAGLILLVLACSGATLQAVAQQRGRPTYVHQAWTTADGLPQNSVTALVRTADGYLWVGTLQGLARFDGVRFTVFDAAQTDGLADDRIASLLEDRHGTLWIGTESGGLSRYQAGRFEAVASGIPDGTAYVLAEDAQGRLWARTAAGLRYFDGVRFVPPSPADAYPREVLALHGDASGALWFGTADGLARLQDGAERSFSTQDGLLSDAVVQLAAQADGPLWVGTQEGISRLDGERFDSFRLTDGTLAGMRVDRDGRIWVWSTEHGLMRFDGARFHDVAIPALQNEAIIQTMIVDDDGLIWIGTRDQGLHRLQERLFEAYSLPDGLPGNIMHAVREGRDGSIWSGTYHRGLARLHGTGMRVYTRQDGLPHHNVHALAEVGDTMWIGTSNGLARFNGTRIETVTLPSEDGRKPGSTIVVPGQGQALWIWEKTGRLFRFEQGRFREVAGGRDLVTVPPHSFYEDQQDVLWIGSTWGQLCRYAEPDMTCYGPQHGLPRRSIREIHERRNGTLWLGTYGGGLCRFEAARATCLTPEHGLPDGTIHRVLEDDLGFVWLSSNKGIFRIPGIQLDRFFDGTLDRVSPDVYGMADGMPSDECNGGVYPAGWKARDGRLWFPTIKGLAVVEPARAAGRIVVPPPARVEALMVDGATLPLEASDVVPAGSDRLTFHYTGLHLQAPEKLRFRYHLDGHDTHWIEAGHDRQATYTNLAPDAYTFNVQAAVGSGAWGDVTALPVRVAPFFYQTAWFRLLSFLTLFGLLTGGYRLRVRRLLEQERLRRSEHEALRLEELDAAKNRFFANLSHEFRSPLTLMLGALEGEDTQTARTLQQQSRRLLHLVNQLLDLSKLEAGRVALDPRPGDVAAFLQRLVQSFQPMAERRAIALQFRAGPGFLPALFDADLLEKMVANLVSNALKFTPEGGKVWVTVKAIVGADRQVFEIVVKDTGPGIPKELLPRIFDRFEQGAGVHEGTGIGLALTKELAELHGGQILVESEEGFGSMFLLRLPLERAEAHESTMPEPKRDFARAEAALHPEGKRATTSTTGNRPVVLVVEDNQDVRALVRGYLDAAYDVVEATDGEDGLAAAHARAPDLIVSDVMMPRMDGLDLVRALRTDEALRTIPIVLLTARADDAAAVEGLAAGADVYLAKPFSAARLRAHVEHLLTSRKALRTQFSGEVVVQPSGIVVSSEDEVFLRDTLDAIDARLGDSTFGVDDLAEAVGLGRRHFERRLKAVTAQTPAALMRQMRLERAVQLLEARTGTVAEIAYAVGFKSPSYFAQVFREAFGVSPTEHIDNAT